MRIIVGFVVTLCVALILPVADGVAQQPRVELELIMGEGFQPQNAQDWLKALDKAGADNIRIRAAQIGDGIGVKNLGSEGRPNYRVYGMLTGDNRLMFEGSTFRISDIGGIKKYLDTLREGGVEGLLGEKVAFGLSARLLVKVHEDLAAGIPFSTRDQSVADLIPAFEKMLQIELELDPSAKKGLREGEPVKEELRGLSAGTALAAICRPLGLVLVPQRDGRDVKLVVTDSQEAEEHWPIGWPIEDGPINVAPKLFKTLPVTIRDFSLREVLEAIQPRTEMPFIYDLNSFARHGVDLDETSIELEGKMSYQRAIRRALQQAKPSLKSELRQDEQGKPFLWITTVRK